MLTLEPKKSFTHTRKRSGCWSAFTTTPTTELPIDREFIEWPQLLLPPLKIRRLPSPFEFLVSPAHFPIFIVSFECSLAAELWQCEQIIVRCQWSKQLRQWQHVVVQEMLAQELLLLAGALPHQGRPEGLPGVSRGSPGGLPGVSRGSAQAPYRVRQV